MWKNGIFKGMEKNGVVEGVEKNWAELMVRAAEDRSNEEYGGFEFHMPHSGRHGEQEGRRSDGWGAGGAAWIQEEALTVGLDSDSQRWGATAAAGSDVSDEGKGKLLSAKEEDGEWWDTVGSPWYPDADFKRYFHMSRSTFEALCEMLAPAVAKEDTQMRNAIPVRKRVAVVVFLLSTGLRCHHGHRPPQFVLWPDATTAASVAAKFKSFTRGIPDIIGAVYTTHIPIKAPEHHVVNYYNAGLTRRNKGKTSYSVSLQASVDADGAFTDVCVGHPGAVPDGDVLLMSTLKTRTVDILGQGKRLIGGRGYPLMDWMLVPYSHQNLKHTQHEFNLKVAAARTVAAGRVPEAQDALGCLQKRSEFKVNNLLAILSACCALHNFCERRGDELDPELPRFQLVDDDVVAPNPVSSAATVQVRDAMANNLLY
ncbi:hypothetical protein ACQ4PT_053084 [Festuca glaucescens]